MPFGRVSRAFWLFLCVCILEKKRRQPNSKAVSAMYKEETTLATTATVMFKHIPTTGAVYSQGPSLLTPEDFYITQPGLFR